MATDRERLEVGSRVWVWWHDLRLPVVYLGDDLACWWHRGTIKNIRDKGKPNGDDLYIEIDGAPNDFPQVRVARFSPNVRPMGLLELIAEAAL